MSPPTIDKSLSTFSSLVAFLFNFKLIWKYSTIFHKIPPPQIPNFTEIRPVGAVQIHVDRQADKGMDRTEEIDVFRDHAKEPNY